MTTTKTTQSKSRAPAAAGPKRMSGPRARYRRKVRMPMAIQMSKPGHVKTVAELKRTGLSRSDLMEDLVHRFGHLIEPVQPGELDSVAAA